MQNSVLFAIVGAVALIAIAGFAVASSTSGGVFGMQSGSGGDHMGMGGDMDGGMMHQWEREYQNNYSGAPGTCPMYNDWNYSYDYDRCPCSG
ncbi:MAG: hypothetical protein A3K67_07655 [Euryarchaeota archaeon RBG_16_62_10]|nr:MAG: hypothetical protein A3K67_07655 [Euryarchaeota archaeon RBG_16_62_10]